MKDETSIFGAKPERLDRLVFEALQDSEAEEAGPTASLGAVLERPGGQIGRYKLLSVLGEGGMGIVYLAEQKQPIKRQVALKVIKPGMDSKRVIGRFEAERQALALLDHPNIAHVYDAGTTEAGRPYFVMEFVKGLSITEHCDHHKLTIEDRLNLFRQVCLAVHHAHQKGIIHRDIKPSNILVSVERDEAIPKVIDFGVAKAISMPLTERTLATEDSQLLGTPEYMSPEQADMASVDIDTRSDVYSLGVLLYVLLTGALPFDSDTLRTGGIEHIRQIIRETDPKTPSTRLMKLGEEAKKVAESRRTEVATLAKKLHKELEWIPLKAMRKERAERYRSASELADDIENYLKGNPLIAGPLTALYQLKKFMRRNRALVAGTLVVFAVSVIGAVVSLIFAFGQMHARAESEAVTNFLQSDVLDSVGKIKGRDATVVDALDVASTNLEGKFEDQPLIEARIRWTLGHAYQRHGDDRAAITHLERTSQILREQPGKHENPATDVSMNYLALAYFRAGQYTKAVRLFNELIEARRRQGRENTGMDLWYKCNLACIYKQQGRYEEAEQLLLTTLETGKWESKSMGMAHYGHLLVYIYIEQGLYEKAEQTYHMAMEAESKFEDPSMQAMRLWNAFAPLRVAQGRYEEAEELFTKGIRIGNSELPGTEHPLTLCHINGLALLRTKQKRYEEAGSLFNQALLGRCDRLGDDHPDTLETKNDLAVLYKEQARYEDAEKLLLEAVKSRRVKLGDEHPHTLESWQNLIDLYEACGKLKEAEKWREKLPQTETVKE